MKTVGFLWLGNELPWFNKVAIKTFQDIGHPVELFCEESLRETESDLPLRDYREVLDSQILTKLGTTPRVASDIFRLILMRDTNYIWADCDCVALQPLPDTDIILARADAESKLLNNNVLRVPSESQELSELLEIALDPEAIPDWVPPRRAKKARQFSGRERREIVTSRQTTFGPDLLNHVFQKSDNIDKAFSHEVFNPIGNTKGYMLFSEGISIGDVSTPKTCVTHFYQANVRRFFHANGPQKGTVLGDLAFKYGITTD